MASALGEPVPVLSVCAAGLMRLPGDALGSGETARGPVTGLGVERVLVPFLGRAIGTGVVERWGWPVEGVVVRRFTVGPHPWSPGHRGVDIAAEAGVPVRAAGDGIVHFAGWVVSRPVVSVAHSNGTRTTYEPVEPSVTAGQTVVTGQIIGVLLTGHDGALHFGLRQGETYLDPLVLLGRGRVRLLPLARPASRRRAGRSPQPCCRSAHSTADSRDHETA
nr:M23 family metallopeptidase [Catelliglobosispora koreensis]